MHKISLLLILGFGSALIFIPDLFRNLESVKNIVGYTSGFISCILLLTLVFIRIIWKDVSIPKKIKLLMFILFLSSFTACFSFALLNAATYANFVYSHFYLNLGILMYLSLASGSSWLMFQDKRFFKKHYTILLSTIPIFLLITGLIMFLLPPHVINRITREDSVVEYLQVIVLFVGSFSSFVTAKRLIGKNIVLSIVFTLVAILLFFIAGDEISWGQRLLHLQTPSGIQSLNTQGEITVHNIYSFDGYVPIGYLLIGVYGSLISMAVRRLKIFQPGILKYLFPPNRFFVLFFLPTLFNGYTAFFDHSIGSFSEPAELLLYSGISLFILELSRKKAIS